MAPDPPRRYKNDDEMTVAEHEKRKYGDHTRTGGPAPQFETDEYKESRRKALEKAGLEPEETD